MPFIFRCYRRLAVIGLLCLVTACTPPLPSADWRAQDDAHDFSAEGRLVVKVEEKGSYANFDWTLSNGVQTVNINTPLGNTLGQLCQDRLGVLALNSKGERFSADTPQKLSRALLGFSLPVQYLGVWAQGQWVKDAPHQIAADGSLQQFEWTIRRSVRENGTPRVLELDSSRLSLRLVFDTMQLQPAGTEAGLCTARTEQP